MKAIVFIFSLSVALFGCDAETPMQQMANNNPDAQARMIAAQYGCMGCHTVDNSVMGPAWRLVAEHYQNQPDARATLIMNVKNGTRGLWANIAQGKVMPGFGGRMSDAEVEVVVDYILGLSK